NLTPASIGFKIVNRSWCATTASEYLMSRLLLTTAALLAAAWLGTSAVHAQGKAQSEPVNIITADGVKLKAVFYPAMMNGAPTKGAPTVILLHPIGDGKS